jgi:hypothetical protein
MAGDEIEVTARLRRRLEEEYGMREAAYLMDRPPGGWESLATKEYLDHRFAALDHRFEALEARLMREIERRFRMQTMFLVSAMIAAFGLFGALVRLG